MKKLAIVTGASSGIGLAIAERLVQEGFEVANWDLREPQASQNQIQYIHCDVSSESAVTKAFQETQKQFGNVPFLLVNNSGLQFMSPVEEFPIEKWNQIIGVVLTGTFLCSKVVAKPMKQSRRGRIINIASIHGKLASPYKSAYVSAKHGVLGFTKVLAQELAPESITVNAICPGFVDTPLMRGQVAEQMKLNNLSEEEVLQKVFLQKQSIKKLTTPDQVASMVVYLASDAASTITGEAFNISGGWN